MTRPPFSLLPHSPHRLLPRLQQLLLPLLLAAVLGCGTTKSQTATDQLLTSDAIDRSVSQIDFNVLQGESVYLDTQFVPKNAKNMGFVSSDYIISSLRQQMFAAGCRLVEKKEEAEYIVELRVGAVGSDAHDVTYGLPANGLISAATSVVPNSPSVPALPEISIARREYQVGASKLAVFAYKRESLEPVWQSGLAAATSSAKSFWVLGAGPFQRGTIYSGTQFAGQRLQILRSSSEDGEEGEGETVARYDREIEFIHEPPPGLRQPGQGEQQQPTRVANFEEDSEAGKEDVKQASGEDAADPSE